MITAAACPAITKVAKQLAETLNSYPLATFSACTSHSLSLVGSTFFGTVQKCYTLLSSSPKRWELLKDEIGVSLHNLSETRSTARLGESNRSLLTSGVLRT